MVTAAVVDDVFLSFEGLPARSPDETPEPTARSLSVTPYAGAAPGAHGEANAAFGVTGRF
jgi:hypothetical protein